MAVKNTKKAVKLALNLFTTHLKQKNLSKPSDMDYWRKILILFQVVEVSNKTIIEFSFSVIWRIIQISDRSEAVAESIDLGLNNSSTSSNNCLLLLYNNRAISIVIG